MTSPMTGAGDVFRGMQVEVAPLRLVRDIAPDPLDAAAAERAESVQRGYQDGLRQGIEEGRKSGHQEGLRQARESVQAQAEAAVAQAVEQSTAAVHVQHARFGELLATMARTVQTAQDVAEDEVVALCFDGLARVMGHEAVRRETVVAHVRHVMDAARRNGEPVTLRLHPDDHDLVRDAGLAWPPGLQCRPDPEVGMGGCILVTSRGALDHRLETAMDGFRTSLLETRAMRRAGDTP